MNEGLLQPRLEGKRHFGLLRLDWARSQERRGEKLS